MLVMPTLPTIRSGASQEACKAKGRASQEQSKGEERDGRGEILRGTEIFWITSLLIAHSSPESVETFLGVSLGSKTHGGRAAPALIDAPLVS